MDIGERTTAGQRRVVLRPGKLNLALGLVMTLVLVIWALGTFAVSIERVGQGRSGGAAGLVGAVLLVVAGYVCYRFLLYPSVELGPSQLVLRNPLSARRVALSDVVGVMPGRYGTYLTLRSGGTARAWALQDNGYLMTAGAVSSDPDARGLRGPSHTERAALLIATAAGLPGLGQTRRLDEAAVRGAGLPHGAVIEHLDATAAELRFRAARVDGMSSRDRQSGHVSVFRPRWQPWLGWLELPVLGSVGVAALSASGRAAGLGVFAIIVLTLAFMGPITARSEVRLDRQGVRIKMRTKTRHVRWEDVLWVEGAGPGTVWKPVPDGAIVLPTGEVVSIPYFKGRGPVTAENPHGIAAAVADRWGAWLVAQRGGE